MENLEGSLEKTVKRSVDFRLKDLIPYKGFSEFNQRHDTPDLVRTYGDLGYAKLIMGGAVLLSLNTAYTVAAVYGATRAIIDLAN